MRLLQFFMSLLFVSFVACNSSPGTAPSTPFPDNASNYTSSKGALLSTRFKSLEELKSVVQVDYFSSHSMAYPFPIPKNKVCLKQVSNGRMVKSELKSGFSDKEIRKAQHEGWWRKGEVALATPELVFYGKDLRRVWSLARRRDYVFGAADVAFYHLAEKMMYNIRDQDLTSRPPEDLSEKGFINTFNHINAQAFMTTLFSEDLADFIADVHERGNMPELITGNFTEVQLRNLDTGPVDNYVDMINNEWGQELGKVLSKKYRIHRNTIWTPELLMNYLNDLQAYYSWAFQIGFKPFKVTDQIVITFSEKINKVMSPTAKLN